MKARDAFGQRLLIYGLGAGAVSAGGAAHATILSYSGPSISGNTIFFDLQNATPPSTTTFAGAEFELNSGVKGPADFTGNLYATANATGVSSGGIVEEGASLLGLFPSELGSGTTIGSGSTFGSGGYMKTSGPPFDTGYWTVPSTGFLGLDIVVGGQTDYGWAEITLNNLDGSAPGSFTLDGYAYDDSGASIVTPQLPAPPVGAVPEPGCTAWLAVGAAGLSMLRLRKKR